MLVRLPRSLAVLLAAIGLFASGCDTASGPPLGASSAERSASDAVTLALDGRPSLDVYYDLAPLARGERFTATLVGSAGSLRLRFDGTGGGRGAVSLSADERNVGVVAVDYLRAGDVVGEGPVGSEGPYTAGDSDREPDSVHYVTYPDGTIEIIYDYDDDNDASGAGTTVRTPGGERLEVTHIRFTVDEAGLGTPELLEFASPSAFALR